MQGTPSINDPLFTNEVKKNIWPNMVLFNAHFGYFTRGESLYHFCTQKRFLAKMRLIMDFLYQNSSMIML